MKKQKIRRYILLKVLNVILRIAEIFLRFMLFFMAISAVIGLALVLMISCNGFMVAFGSCLMAIFFILVMVNQDKLHEIANKAVYENSFVDRFFSDLLARKGYQEKIIKSLIEIRSSLGSNSLKSMIPILHKLHTLNVNAKAEQTEFLAKRFVDEEIQLIFERDYSDSEIEKSFNYFRKYKDQAERKAFIIYLFQFSILEDGIHKDEWYTLLNFMSMIKLNKVHFSAITSSYYSLRTEFEEWEKRSASTEENKATSTLKAYYATLGLEESASEEEVKKAYHALAMLHHPDLPKNADRVTECEAMMAKINEAYEKIRG